MEHRPYANDPGLRLIFGDADVTEGLRVADLALRGFADRLRSRTPDGRFHTRGLQIADYPGPPRKVCLEAYVEAPEVRFMILLARGDFYLNAGDPDGFFLEAEVATDPPDSAPRWEPEWVVFRLPDTGYETAEEAVAALRDAIATLREESERHAPTQAAWLARLQRDGDV